MASCYNYKGETYTKEEFENFLNNTDLSEYNDKVWKYEILDADINDFAVAELQRDFQFENENEVSLQSLIGIDNEVMKAYPQLGNIKIVAKQYLDADAVFYEDKQVIELAPNILFGSEKNFKSVLSHEIQHAIQSIEGFALGGAAEDMESIADFFVKSGGERRLNELESKNENDLSYQEKLDIVRLQTQKEKAIEEIDKYKGDVKYNKYRNLAGEVEARNVQTRLNLTEEQRRQTLIQDTEDVAIEDQIFLRNNLGISQSIQINQIQEVLKQLEKTGLADNVFLLSNQEIENKLIELGVDANVARQVVAYHGSPYSFDRFTTDKMGTGEGAQAFGWGLYFTDLESIAKNYADKLGAEKITFEGVDINDTKGWNEAKEALSNLGGLFDGFGFFRSITKIEKLANKVKSEYLPYLASEKINNIDKIQYQEYVDSANFLLDNIDKFKVEKGKNLYKVSLHQGKTPDQYTWLDWDKEVSDDILDKINKNLEDFDFDGIYFTKDEDIAESDKKAKFITTGEDLYKVIGAQLWKWNGDKADWSSNKRLDKDASLLLLDIGIDGIKYPAESVARGATSDTARGFNYVVFDENAITIEEQIQFQKQLAAQGINFMFTNTRADYSNQQTQDLLRATQLKEQGLSAEEIKATTNWYFDNTEGWLYETIDDRSTAVINIINTIEQNVEKLEKNEVISTTAKDIIGENEIFKLVKDFNPTVEILIKNENSFYDSINNKIYLNIPNIDIETINDSSVTIYHEIQHAAAYKLGMAKGTNAKTYQKIVNFILEETYGIRPNTIAHNKMQRAGEALYSKSKGEVLAYDTGERLFDKTQLPTKLGREVLDNIKVEKDVENALKKLGLIDEKGDSIDMVEALIKFNIPISYLIGIQKSSSLAAKGITQTTNGFIIGSDIYINTEGTNPTETLLHEFSHSFINKLKTARPELYKKGLELAKSEDAKPYIEFVKQNQPNLEEGTEKFENEVLAQAVGDNGAKLVKAESKNVIAQIWDWIKGKLGLTQMSNEVVAKMTLQEYVDSIAVDLLFGEKLFVGQNGEANFNRWKGSNKLVQAAEIQDVKTGEPIVAKVYHGTTNEFYEFDASVKGNIEGHLGKVNYFTSDIQDAKTNYLSDGADITGRLENLRERILSDLENEVDDSLEEEEREDKIREVISEEYPDFDSSSLDFNMELFEVADRVSSSLLLGGEEKVLELYVKLNNPVVLGNKSSWFETLNVSEEDLDTAAQEIADEYDISLEEAKDDYKYEVQQRAIENTGYENLHIEALTKALEDNGYDSSRVSNILGDNYFEIEVDLNKLEQDLREAELSESDNGEIAGSQVIADFFKNLGFDGIILTNVSDRFRNMGLGSTTSHIHVFDEFNNQIKLSDGSNVTFNENTSDIRFQKAAGITKEEAIKRNNGNPLNLAPNGKPSILYQSYLDLGYSESEAERLTAQVFSDSFINNFFGDWINDAENASKVVDSNGQPLIVFHSTDSNFTEFDKNKIGKNWTLRHGNGFYFSSGTLGSSQWGFNKMKVFLSIKNIQQSRPSFSEEARQAGFVNEYDNRVDTTSYATSKGIDGLFAGDNFNKEFIVFNPNQIKSATENIGTFDSGSNDIRFQLLTQEDIDNLPGC